MKVSESPYGFTETYTVKFWYQNEEGYWRQQEIGLYCNSKSAHSCVEKYFMKYLAKFYKGARIVSVTYN
jgi:hypothetical protein